MSDAHAEIGYVGPASQPEPASPPAGALVLPGSLVSVLRAVAKGRAFSRRIDTLFRLDELARGGLIARADADAPWVITEAGKAHLALVAQRHREWLEAQRRKRARRGAK